MHFLIRILLLLIVLCGSGLARPPLKKPDAKSAEKPDIYRIFIRRGEQIGRSLQLSGAGDAAGIRVTRQFADQIFPPYGADMLEIAGRRGLHVVTVRWVLEGYLHSAFGYSRWKSRRLATELLKYNGRLHGQNNYLWLRYSREVRTLLGPRFGLVAGTRRLKPVTRLVIPLRLSEIGAPGISTVELKTSRQTMAAAPAPIRRCPGVPRPIAAKSFGSGYSFPYFCREKADRRIEKNLE